MLDSRDSKNRRLRGVIWLRLLHRMLPLQHRWLWLVRRHLRGSTEATVPWGSFSLTFSTTWRDFSVVSPIFVGPAMNPELRLLKQLAGRAPEGTWVDVGANIGCYVLAFRQLTRGPIIAYEPLPQLFRLLGKNVAENELTDVTLRNKACGEKGGSALMVPGANAAIADGESAGQPSENEAVDVVALDDDLSGERVGLLKIDVEGFEARVLLGARKILEEQRPLLFIEVHPNLLRRYGACAAELIGLLSDKYDLSCWDYGTENGLSRPARILARYFPRGARRFASVEEFIRVADGGTASPQLFLCGIPKCG